MGPNRPPWVDAAKVGPTAGYNSSTAIYPTIYLQIKLSGPRWAHWGCRPATLYHPLRCDPSELCKAYWILKSGVRKLLLEAFGQINFTAIWIWKNTSFHQIFKFTIFVNCKGRRWKLALENKITLWIFIRSQSLKFWTCKDLKGEIRTHPITKHSPCVVWWAASLIS